jgi:hypothetical protein
MTPQVQISEGKPDRQVFFQGAMLDIYQAENHLFGFTYYKYMEFWAIFNVDPIYLSAEVALRYAKLYAIKANVTEDTKSIKFAVDSKTDEILHQSPPAKKTFGKAQGYAAQELYLNHCDRATIRKKTLLTGKTCDQVLLQSLDGKQLYGTIEIEVMTIDSSTVLSIETFTLGLDSRFH